MKFRTRQEIFNVAYRGLASQGFRQSKLDGLSCAYRGQDNKRCAIGWCISDTEYSPKMERGTPALTTFGTHDEFTKRNASIRVAAGVRDEDAEWARDLQQVHDDFPVPAGLKSELEAFAAKHDLTIPEGFDDLLTAQEPETGIPATEPEAVA